MSQLESSVNSCLAPTPARSPQARETKEGGKALVMLRTVSVLDSISQYRFLIHNRQCRCLLCYGVVIIIMHCCVGILLLVRYREL